MNHISIIESLGELTAVIVRLEQFVDRVENEDPQNEDPQNEDPRKEGPMVTPSLRDVLRMTPQQINEHVKRIADALYRLDSALYNKEDERL